MVFHHFGLDQFALPFHFQRDPRRRTQRADVADFGGVVVFDFLAGQRHLMRTEQQVTLFAQAQAIGVAEEVVDEVVGRVLVDLARRADLFDHTLVHHHDAISHFHGLFLIVSHEHRGQVDVLVQARQPATQLLADLGVQRAERLVQQQHFWLDRQGAGQGNALALSTRQLLRITVGQPVQLHHVQ